MNNRKYLTTGDKNPLLPELLDLLWNASEIEIAVAFIKKSGLQLLFSALEDALKLDSQTGQARAKLSIISTDYLYISDPEAYRMLMLLKERGADIKVYSNPARSFHMKAYIGVKSANNTAIETSAFIGSSNISKSALTTGLEWNYRVFSDEASSPEQHEIMQNVRDEFQKVFIDPKSVELTHDWVSEYSERKLKRADIIFADFPREEVAKSFYPNAIQQEALLALNETRNKGYKRGLAVLATGLGKTWLSAFDVEQMKAKRVLFVAHRQEILIQAEQTFLNINPTAKVGFYNAKQKQVNVDILCASVQTLGKESHLNSIAPDYFDYIVIDEFHHASAKTYRNIINYFKPKFLLGLTATPNRTDQADIFSLCDDNIVYECSLDEGINSGLLAPFDYYGIFDDAIDYKEIPWRNNKFETRQLENQLATLKRAKNIQKAWLEHRQKRTLAFCITRHHADFMAKQFSAWGIKAVSCHGDSSIARTKALSMLEANEIEVIFSVDLFNEGVDLPSIDTVLMLRPTESKVLFLQQLGRGLRKSDEKERLKVIDFIGNHHSFFNKQQALFNVTTSAKSIKKWVKDYKQGLLVLPDGCFINYDVEYINFIEKLEVSSSNKLLEHYKNLSLTLNRRPTLSEAYRDDVNIQKIRTQYGSWWEFVRDQGDFPSQYQQLASVIDKYQDFYLTVEKASMSKCFKMILLEALIENNGFMEPPTLEDLCQQSLQVFNRRVNCISDLKYEFQDLHTLNFKMFVSYWKSNPIKAWLGSNKNNPTTSFFKLDEVFHSTLEIDDSELDVFNYVLQELINYKFISYWDRYKSRGEIFLNVASEPEKYDTKPDDKGKNNFEID